MGRDRKSSPKPHEFLRDLNSLGFLKGTSREITGAGARTSLNRSKPAEIKQLT